MMFTYNLDDLKKPLRNSYGADTSACPLEWTSNNRSRGQSDITALLINHFLGGLILRSISDAGIVHYWNRINDVKHDLTFNQYTYSEYHGLFQSHISEVGAVEMLQDNDVKRRYELLLTKVEAELPPKKMCGQQVCTVMSCCSRICELSRFNSFCKEDCPKNKRGNSCGYKRCGYFQHTNGKPTPIRDVILDLINIFFNPDIFAYNFTIFALIIISIISFVRHAH